MAGLDKKVYSGKKFESYISLQSDALGTNDVSGTLYKIRTTEVNDIDIPPVQPLQMQLGRDKECKDQQIILLHLKVVLSLGLLVTMQ